MAIKLNSNDSNYHLIRGYKAKPKKLFEGSNINNTLCQDLNSYIFYLDSTEMNGKNYFNINTKIYPQTLVKIQ